MATRQKWWYFTPWLLINDPQSTHNIVYLHDSEESLRIMQGRGTVQNASEIDIFWLTSHAYQILIASIQLPAEGARKEFCFLLLTVTLATLPLALSILWNPPHCTRKVAWVWQLKLVSDHETIMWHITIVTVFVLSLCACVYQWSTLSTVYDQCNGAERSEE